MQNQPNISALIIEDELHAQDELIRILTKYVPHCKVCGVADGVEKACELIAELKPDLIFMDIQLSDGLSFDIFSQVEVDCPVIFTTAFDDFALQAFKSNGIDYLLKPIEPEAIVKAVSKFSRWYGTGQLAEKNRLISEEVKKWMQQDVPTFKNRFMATVGDRIKFLNDHEVAYFEASDDVVFMVGHDGKRYIINYTLENLEGLVNPQLFFRLNRSFIAHIDSIAEIHKYFNSRLKIQLKPQPADAEVLVSRLKVQPFLSWIGQ